MKTSIFILIIILFSQTCSTLFANTINIKAKNGKIDLSLWNNNKNGIIKLDGEWEFYWNRLLFHDDFINSSQVMTGYINVPKKWNNIEFKNIKIKYEGCATYRLLVTGLSKGEIYGVKFRDAGIAYSMFVDGKQVLFNGVVSSSKENEVPQYLGKYGNFIASKDTTEFIFQVSNFHHVKGGFWNTLELGKSESIIEKVQFETGYDMFIIGAIIIIAFYHLGIFIFRRKDKASLYFSFFCFFIALRSMIVSDYKYLFSSLSISWEYIFKVDLIFSIISFPLFFMFLASFYNMEHQKNSVKIIALTSISAVLFILIVRDIKIVANFFYIYRFFVISYSVFMLYIFIRITLKREYIPFFSVIGFFVLVLTLILDLLRSANIMQTIYLFPTGLFIFILLHSLAMSLKFSTAFDTIENLNVILGSKNSELSSTLSQLEEVQNSLIQSEKLALIGQIAGSINHEIKNPLGAIYTSSQLLTDDIKFLENEKVYHKETIESIKEEAEIISLAASQAKGIIMNMLNFSRTDTSNFSNVSLNRIIDNTSLLVKKELVNHKIKLITNIESDLIIKGNVGELTQVFLNFILNGKDAILEKNSNAGKIEIKGYKKDNLAIIEIEDNGKGISKDNQEKLFKPFFTTKSKGKGTGLGLSVSNSILQKHNADISIESEEGIGTKFIITFKI